MKILFSTCLLLVALTISFFTIATAETWERVYTPDGKRQNGERQAEKQGKYQETEQERKAKEKQARAEKDCRNARGKGHKNIDVLKACGAPIIREPLPGYQGVTKERWYYDGFEVTFTNGKVMGK